MKSEKDGHVEEVHRMMKRSLHRVKRHVKFGGLMKSKSRSLSDIKKTLTAQVTVADLDKVFGTPSKKKKGIARPAVSTEVVTPTSDPATTPTQQSLASNITLEHTLRKLERHIDRKFWQLSTALRIPTRHFNDGYD